MFQHRAHRRARRVIAQLGSGALVVAGTALIATTVTGPAANAAQSISTTTNVADANPLYASGPCVNPDETGTGEDPTNCNAYAAKSDVWLSNLPHNLPAGKYFLAVNEPGSQSEPNDGTDGLLSSDARANRIFTVAADGTISTAGSHHVSSDGLRIEMAPFLDSPNGGGVYNASVCVVPQPDENADVSGDDCNHDSFKVATDTPPDPAKPLTVSKDAAGAYTSTYAWDIDKTVDDNTLSGVSGSVTANYTVSVGHGAAAVSGTQVSGTITVSNPNADPVVADISDTFSDANISCNVTGAGDDVVVAPGNTPLAYTCDLPEGAVPAADLTNTVLVEWDVQMVGDLVLDASSATDTTGAIAFTETVVDECVDVTDTYAGVLGSVCVGDANPTAFHYSRTWQLTTAGCVTYPNTATFTTNDTAATGSDSENVEVCKTPLVTGAHTIGFWSSKNGQGVITGGAATAGVCNSGAYLRTFKPFQDLSATANCAAVTKYVSGVISKATASTMNPMLKAQMLATALSVYYTSPQGTTAATQKFLPILDLGGVDVDLTNIKGRNVSGAFGGATHLTVSAMLTYAASQSNAGTSTVVGGSIWYGNVKAVQTDAKDAFDAINNNAVFAP